MLPLAVELFSGTKSFCSVASERGYATLSYDKELGLSPDVCIDVLDIGFIPQATVLWASPPCQTFSVASIGKHWTGGHRAYIPNTEECRVGLTLLDKTLELISLSEPTYWFVENPVGVMRKVIDPMLRKHSLVAVRQTITYCQYGDTRMKPTDIWTNCVAWIPKPKCKNGDPCHQRAPRGAKTGTQGLSTMDRGKVPRRLVEELLDTIRRGE